MATGWWPNIRAPKYKAGRVGTSNTIWRCSSESPERLGSTALAQWRAAGRWPACLDTLWRQLEERRGKSTGTRAMITLVRAGLVAGWARLIGAVDEALRLGVSDEAAVLHLLRLPTAEELRCPALVLAEDLASFRTSAARDG